MAAIPLSRWLAAAALGRRVFAALVLALLLAGSLPPLTRYYDRAFDSRENNARAFQLTELVTHARAPHEPLVLDESFGSEYGSGATELRALRFLLSFHDVPVTVLKITPRRLESELDESASLLVVLNGRQLREYDRLPLQALTSVPQRGSEVGLFRLSERGGPRRQ
jgi:hypothetical protein